MPLLTTMKADALLAVRASEPSGIPACSPHPASTVLVRAKTQKRIHLLLSLLFVRSVFQVHILIDVLEELVQDDGRYFGCARWHEASDLVEVTCLHFLFDCLSRTRLAEPMLAREFNCRIILRIYRLFRGHDWVLVADAAVGCLLVDLALHLQLLRKLAALLADHIANVFPRVTHHLLRCSRVNFDNKE
jgi:hypothetical protein